MKIAVVDLYPHICGPSTYTFAVQEGMRRLGHHCDVVAFTKSGKPTIRWDLSDVADMPHRFVQDGTKAARRGPDVLAMWGEGGAEALSSYDGIVLGEPRCISLDKEAERDFDDPPYLELLRLAGRPFTSYMPAPQYGEGTAPFMADLLALDNYCGTMVIVDRSFMPEALRSETKIIVDDLLPYVPRRAIDDDFPKSMICGAACRLAPNKAGWTNMIASLGALPEHWQYEIWGACPKGTGPSMIWRLREFLEVAYGIEQFSWALGDKYESRGVLRTDPFSCVLKNRHVLTVAGGYADPMSWGERLSVCINLSNKSFTQGTIEYVGLEALDAGCQLVTARHLGGQYFNSREKGYYLGGYLVDVVENFTDAATFKQGADTGDGKKRATGEVNKYPDDVRKEFENVVCRAMARVEMSSDTDEYRERVRYNRSELRRLHDPKNHAVKLVAALFP